MLTRLVGGPLDGVTIDVSNGEANLEELVLEWSDGTRWRYARSTLPVIAAMPVEDPAGGEDGISQIVDFHFRREGAPPPHKAPYKARRR